MASVLRHFHVFRAILHKFQWYHHSQSTLYGLYDHNTSFRVCISSIQRPFTARFAFIHSSEWCTVARSHGVRNTTLARHSSAPTHYLSACASYCGAPGADLVLWPILIGPALLCNHSSSLPTHSVPVRSRVCIGRVARGGLSIR